MGDLAAGTGRDGELFAQDIDLGILTGSDAEEAGFYFDYVIGSLA